MKKSLLFCVIIIFGRGSFASAQSLFLAPSQGEGIFKTGLPVVINDQGYYQSEVLLNNESLYNGLSFYNTETQTFCSQGKTFKSIATGMLIGSVALAIGGTAVTIVAASGTSDYDGTMAMYATGIGLYLGCAGVALGSNYFRGQSEGFYRQAVEAYNVSLP